MPRSHRAPLCEPPRRGAARVRVRLLVTPVSVGGDELFAAQPFPTWKCAVHPFAAAAKSPPVHGVAHAFQRLNHECTQAVHRGRRGCGHVPGANRDVFHSKRRAIRRYGEWSSRRDAKASNIFDTYWNRGVLSVETIVRFGDAFDCVAGSIISSGGEQDIDSVPRPTCWGIAPWPRPRRRKSAARMGYRGRLRDADPGQGPDTHMSRA